MSETHFRLLNPTYRNVGTDKKLSLVWGYCDKDDYDAYDVWLMVSG